jgi:hypothetical protein
VSVTSVRSGQEVEPAVLEGKAAAPRRPDTRIARRDSPGIDALWTAEDVAAYLQASRSWVYQKAEAAVLPSLRVCGLLRFDPAVVRAFARGEIQPAAVIPLRREP